MAVHFAEDFATHMAQFQAADEERIEWMKTFTAQLSVREDRFQNTSRDLETERDARRLKQQEVDYWKAKFVELQQSIERSSFVLVLVDADADSYIFKDEYYAAADGGRKAVLDIRKKVRDHLNKKHPEMASLPIVIKAYANEDGLSQLLMNAGIIRSPQSLLSFTKDFSQACKTADFVLVGSGKDRADKKITSVFKQFIDNPTCRHVIFGACHDNNYVRLLEDYTNDTSIVERVTLLRGFQVGREFGGLQFNQMQMNVFRDRPVRGGSPVGIAAGQSLPETIPDSNRPSSSWAAAVGTKTKGDATSCKVVKKVVRVNMAGQRIDEDLPEAPRQAVDSWHQKTKLAGMRYCRPYQLSGFCTGRCGYSHGPLSEEEKVAVSRSILFLWAQLSLQ
ncbi:Fc.00g043040.m01.CDS01 [Cosmosporella sp. VM-42]